MLFKRSMKTLFSRMSLTIPMHTLQIPNFNYLINGLRIKPLSKLRLFIPLCHLKPLPLVRLVLEIDVMKLENKFVNGYGEGDRVFHV